MKISISKNSFSLQGDPKVRIPVLYFLRENSRIQNLPQNIKASDDPKTDQMSRKIIYERSHYGHKTLIHFIKEDSITKDCKDTFTFFNSFGAL